MNWYKTGFGGIDDAEKEQASHNIPWDFWLRPSESAEITFLDDECFEFWEHELEIANKWGNYFTCLRGIDPKGCPICDSFGEKHRYYVGLFTIVDHRETVDKRGNKRFDQRRLLRAKMKSLKKLRRQKEKRGSLVGARFLVTRNSSEEPRIGDEWEWCKDRDLAKEPFAYRGKDGKTVTLEPTNYKEAFAPKSYAAIKALLTSAHYVTGGTDTGASSGSVSSGSDEDDDIPF